MKSSCRSVAVASTATVVAAAIPVVSTIIAAAIAVVSTMVVAIIVVVVGNGIADHSPCGSANEGGFSWSAGGIGHRDADRSGCDKKKFQRVFHRSIVCGFTGAKRQAVA